ncbi:hypothetical protein [Couchioplanes azureus]|uniref:hypothetical protein n=1 Tax=Couchioplanes caeruleus TaxID=56438 RepID=UPI00166FAE3B|nr:hypothetical protein [Couchioplanes caeruleus]
MTTYLVDVHHRTHICPANPKPHPYDTRRTIVAVLPAQPCQRPVTVRSGNRSAVIDCGRHEPAERQCDACRTTIVKRRTTATFTGPVGTAGAAA